jgi:peptidoglycan glycosyltransferase
MGVYNGAVVVTNPKTGEILAMVSKPDFDPNDIEEEWGNLVSQSVSSVLLNRATQGLYPPGSTFKIVTALEYIRENPSTYMDYSFDCKGSITIDGTKIKCYHGSRHGQEDLTKSFAKSCNSSFANISTTLDWNKMSTTATQLLFGQTLPFDMKTSPSNMLTGSDMTTEDKMQTGIGQGTTVVTPLHMNMITCAIANGGVLQNPYLLDKVVSHNGDLVKQFSSSGTETLMTNQEAEIMTGLMKAVVEEGTASKLSGLSYTAAGKTGSAEFDKESDSHAWFTGFAPADDPEICVTVIVEGAGSGGDYAVPIAKKVFNTYFDEK